jgi:hypothetical protein
MSRLHFDVLSARDGGFHEAELPMPHAAPPGYTPMILIVEWLTLNCRGDWACRAKGRTIIARFVRADDRARSLAWFLGPG